MNLASVLFAQDRDAHAARQLVPTPAPAVQATAHACLRYAQRVLALRLDEQRLRDAPDLRGRCERGIARLMDRASCARRDGDIEVWVARTRALVVTDSRVLTVLVAPTNRGFGKRFFR